MCVILLPLLGIQYFVISSCLSVNFPFRGSFIFLHPDCLVCVIVKSRAGNSCMIAMADCLARRKHLSKPLEERVQWKVSAGHAHGAWDVRWPYTYSAGVPKRPQIPTTLVPQMGFGVKHVWTDFSLNLHDRLFKRPKTLTVDLLFSNFILICGPG